MKSLLYKLIVILLVGIAFQAHASNSSFTFTGYLVDEKGNAITGSQSLMVNLYAAASGGDSVFTETQTVTFTNGFFSFLTTTTIPTLGDATFVGYTVGDGEEKTPRVELSAAAYALGALNCTGCTVLSTTATTDVNATDIADERLNRMTISADTLSIDNQAARVFATGSVDTSSAVTQPVNVVFAGTNVITRDFPLPGGSLYNWWIDCSIIRIDASSADVTCKFDDYEESGMTGGNSFLDTAVISTDFTADIDVDI
ncbi:MAG: hypothetical protein QF535_18895, partial [Anaerolineales bacterium]|nr:hypothetical protein [Anaerolineales bacterium]